MFFPKKFEDARYYFKTGHGLERIIYFCSLISIEGLWKDRDSWIIKTQTASPPIWIHAWNHVEEDFIEIYSLKDFGVANVEKGVEAESLAAKMPRWSFWSSLSSSSLSRKSSPLQKVEAHLCHHPHYQENHHHCTRLELKKVIFLIIFVIILIITKIITITIGWSSPLDRGHLPWRQPVLLRRNSCCQVSFKLSINYHGYRLDICQKIYTIQFSGKRLLHTENT